MRGQRSVGRRCFLLGAAACTVASVSGCGGDSTDPNGEEDAGDRSAHRSVPPTTRHSARLTGDPFTLGVASGDPQADRVILWTRLAPAPLEPGLAGMPDAPVDVIWQVATDDRFRRLVAQGTTAAEPATAHSVHVDATGLEPTTDYTYRFVVGDWTSPVGRTRTTAPPGQPLERLGLAVVACQHFGSGYYAAYRHLQDEDLDLVVHLGDYIYEAGGGLPERPVAPDHVPSTLDDYRRRHASYRLDPDLQAAHARFPFMCVWDDHEVVNNYAGDTALAESPPAAVRQLRTAAYQAYWEHLPLRLGPPDGPALRVYRAVTFGDLARIYLLDGRQYADPPPCRDTSGNDFGDCPERLDAGRRYLGDAQDSWFASELAEGGVAWNVVGNPTVMAGINMGPTTRPGYYLETWDGYPAARRRILEQLGAEEVVNPVVLSGDWHAGMVNHLHVDPSDRSTPMVAPELVVPAVSSPVYDAPREQNPQIRHLLLRHGYLTVRLERERLVGVFRVLDDVRRPESGIATESRWRVSSGDPTPHPL
jgi:alkaline phosphatase D